MNLQKYPRKSFPYPCFFLLMLTFHSKMTWSKSIISCNLSFINPYSAHFGLKFLKKIPVISLYWFAAQ